MIPSLNNRVLLIRRFAAGVALFGLGLSVFAVVAVACRGETAGEPATGGTHKVRVVTTTAILADFASNVGGGRVEVHSIVPPGGDVHSFQSTPQDSVAISNAKVLVSNGLGLDDFLDPLMESAGRSDATRVVAARGLEPDRGKSFEEEEESDLESAHARGDPHFWQNPLYSVYYVELIRDGLIQADPGSSHIYEDNAATYIRKLLDLDTEIGSALNAVPPQRRRLVTMHDAFGHFAERYGWDVSALAPHDGSDVTPGKVVTILEQIKNDGLPAVFVEPQFGNSLLDQAADDMGIKVGIFYSDTLNPTVPTYLDMMRFNVRSLVEHLR